MLFLFIWIYILETNPSVPDMKGFDYDDVTSCFRWIYFTPCPYVYTFLNLQQIFKAIIGDKWVTAGLQKKGQ